jgi:predicted metal-dependent enzyme (double-stranded beta helix superfamily)
MPDEYVLDTPPVRAFIADVYAALEQEPSVEAALETLRPRFAALLADPHWLPPEFMQGIENSGMGGGIATWLIYRAEGGGLSLFSLVVPPAATTPVHDHLAWGLVGLYAGEQAERVYRRAGADDASYAHSHAGHQHISAPLELVARKHLRPGDFYVLLPPEGDIHSVATVSEAPSVSIHLLGNDTGCVWRHSYSPEAGTATAFRSGWSNVPCREE